jgi:hypothetical protein
VLVTRLGSRLTALIAVRVVSHPTLLTAHACGVSAGTATTQGPFRLPRPQRKLARKSPLRRHELALRLGDAVKR